MQTFVSVLSTLVGYARALEAKGHANQPVCADICFRNLIILYIEV